MADLVIGARRSNQRSVRGVAIAVALVLACILVANFIYERVVSYAEPTAASPRGPVVVVEDSRSATGAHLEFGDSTLGYAGSIAVLRASGLPRQVGAAHGRLLGDSIAGPVGALAATITHTVPRDGLLGRAVYGFRLRWRCRLLDDGIPGHQLVEIAGVLSGMRRSSPRAPEYEAFVRRQAALDVGVAAPWSSGAEFRAVTRSLSFVAPLRGPSGDRLLIGRSFALPGAGDGGDAAAAGATVSFIRADSVIPFASIGWPGLVGAVSGLNAEGVAILVHPVRTRDVVLTRKAQPMTLIARDVLENAHDLDEAVAILKHAEILGAAAFLVADGDARRWAVVERSPSRFHVVRDPNPAVVSDLLHGEAFADDPDVDRAGRIQPAADREKRVVRLLRARIEHPSGAAAVLRDRAGPSGRPLPLGHRGAVYDPSAVHAAVFDVSGMVVWIADDGDAGGRFRAFDLRHELRGEGARPAPPADLAAEDQRDESASRRVRLARQVLRQARTARDDDDLPHARELVQRALIHAPDLPEALHLAGDLAREAGDHEAARLHYTRFLAVGPDDRGAEQDIEAWLGD